jgi:N-acetylglucosaminyl-diphospho-decaprenol L-rhamnosyltransferase
VAPIDVVVVSYNSAGMLREAVEALAEEEDVDVIVVDNASEDASLATVANVAVATIAQGENRGFAFGCNRGWRRGSAPAVLFLNPDARIDAASLRRLAAVLQEDASVGLVAPCITGEDGSVEPSLRRFPRLRSTYARAFFLHRLLPHAAWTDEIVREPDAYTRPGTVEWVSGACVLARRSVLEELGGWDEGFFLYGEDVDLCRRVWRAGYTVRFEPSARAVHIGGASAPRAQLLPLLAASRVRYARLHHGRTGAALERAGVALGELTHAALTTKGSVARAGHLKAFLATCSRRQETANRSASHDSVPTAVEVESSDD